MRLIICLIALAYAHLCGSAAFAADNTEYLHAPMTVTVVRGGGSGCEPICPEWIAAEGQIVAATPRVFQQVLEDQYQWGNKLPIFIDSRGGNLDAALKIGTMIYDKGLTVAIASTGYLNCDPRTLKCSKGNEQEGIYRGFELYAGYCHSACLLILAAGKERLSGGAMNVATEHLSTFSARPARVIESEIATYFSKTLGNAKLLDLLKKAEKGDPDPFQISNSTLRELSVITSDDWAGHLVPRGLCQHVVPAPKNCILKREPADSEIIEFACPVCDFTR
jgi:hypothetical protein